MRQTQTDTQTETDRQPYTDSATQTLPQNHTNARDTMKHTKRKGGLVISSSIRDSQSRGPGASPGATASVRFFYCTQTQTQTQMKGNESPYSKAATQALAQNDTQARANTENRANTRWSGATEARASLTREIQVRLLGPLTVLCF